MAILHILSSFFFVFIRHSVLRLFHDSTAKEIHSCISTPGQDCVVSFLFMDSSEQINRTYPNLVAKIQVYMSNKTQNSNNFSLLQKSGLYKNMLNFMAIVYIYIYSQRNKLRCIVDTQRQCMLPDSLPNGSVVADLSVKVLPIVYGGS